jgi:Mrp family chromosome partitioning ATPase
VELSFVISAIRRYLWLPLVGALLGGLAGFAVENRGTSNYESVAIMLVTPPSESRVNVSFTSDPDRYVVGELSVLRSTALAETVAAAVGGGISTAQVQASTTFTHELRTDIVSVVAATADPELSKKIADAYLDLYFERINAAVDEQQGPEIESLDNQLADLNEQIKAVDAEIDGVMKPYLDRLEQSPDSFIPGLEQVAPDLVSRKESLQSEYSQLLSSRTQLEVSQRLRVTSQTVQRGTVPSDAAPPATVLVYAGAIGGFFAGIIGAVLLGRLSPKVLDQAQASEVLGRPVVGEFPSARSLAKSRRAALNSLPPNVIPFVDSLCVRAEATARPGAALVVVVAGSERSAGTTTLAAAMANRYAALGSQVLLVDADLRHPEVTSLFAPGRPGIAALLNQTEDADANGQRRRPSLGDPFTPSGVPGLSVIGLGDKSASAPLRRQNVQDVVDAASRHAHVVVFDGGPLLDSATTVQLAQLADAVVLTMPMKRQRLDALVGVVHQIRASKAELLPVGTPAGRARTADAPVVVVPPEVQLTQEPRR